MFNWEFDLENQVYAITQIKKYCGNFLLSKALHNPRATGKTHYS